MESNGGGASGGTGGCELGLLRGDVDLEFRRALLNLSGIVRK